MPHDLSQTFRAEASCYTRAIYNLLERTHLTIHFGTAATATTPEKSGKQIDTDLGLCQQLFAQAVQCRDLAGAIDHATGNDQQSTLWHNSSKEIGIAGSELQETVTAVISLANGDPDFNSNTLIPQNITRPPRDLYQQASQATLHEINTALNTIQERNDKLTAGSYPELSALPSHQIANLLKLGGSTHQSLQEIAADLRQSMP